jgi:PAS domain S-box-containing protein
MFGHPEPAPLAAPAVERAAWSTRSRPRPAHALGLKLWRWCTGLGGRLVLLMALAAGLSGVAIGVAVMERAREGLREDILRRQLATADLAAAISVTFLNGVQDDVRELAGRPTLLRLVEWGDWPGVTTELEHWVRAERRGVDSVYMYDAIGTLRATGQGDKGVAGPTDQAGDEALRQVLATGLAQMLGPRRSTVTEQPVVPYLVAMRDARGEIRAVVRVAISLRTLSEKLLDVQPGLNGRMSLDDVDSRTVLAHVDPRRILRQSSGKNQATERMYRGERGAIENVNSTGQRTLAAYTSVPGTRWSVMVQQPLVDAYAPLDAMERDAIRLIALALLVAAGVGGAVAVWVVRPLGRLRAAADAMANGDLTRRTGVARDDEIGDLASAFDRMASELEARDARLAGALQRLRSVVDAVDDAIVVCDADERVVSCNPAGKRLFGRSGPALFGRPLRSLVGDLPDPLAASDAVLETIARRPDGSELPVGVIVRATPVRSGHQYVAVLHDLSARKATERAAALEELNRLQSEFISIASHELRTPATAVLGFSEILVDRLEADDPNRDIATMVHEQSIQLASLLEDVLDASRLEAGRVELHLEPVDLSSLLESLLTTVAGRAPSHRLVTDLAPGTSALQADPIKLKRILGNLIDNAVKYSPQGGAVTVSARLLESPGWVEIAVADEGIGIPIDQLETVFDRFHRVDATDTRRVRGTGLGLYIVRQLVDLHGGKIRAEGRLGGGSVFRLELPTGCAAARTAASEIRADGVLVG